MTIINTAVSHLDHRLPIQLEPPDHCPICNHGMEPKFLTAIWKMDDHLLEVAFRCPRKSCQSMFIGTYRDMNFTNTDWRLQSLAPYRLVPPKYPEVITKLSPRFVQIMGQVAVAEIKELDQLVGMGLRKALEFLIKDFTIQEHPEHKANIEGQDLAYVIGQYVTDANIKTVAKRAAWLGNDETHFLRIWKDKDITDLKKLVQLTVHWIDSHEMTKEYRTDMPEKKRQ